MARMRKKLGAVLVSAAALSLTLTACGGGGGESESGGGGEGEVIDTSTASGDVNYWLWDDQPTARVPSLCRRVQDGQPQRQRQDHPVWMGRLLGQAHQRLHRRRCSRRLHRPPVQVPGVRQPAAAGRAGRDAHQGWLQRRPVPARPGGSVEGPRRQALRPAQGFRHHCDLLQQEAGLRRGSQGSRSAESHLEPHRRRHV